MSAGKRNIYDIFVLGLPLCLKSSTELLNFLEIILSINKLIYSIYMLQYNLPDLIYAKIGVRFITSFMTWRSAKYKFSYWTDL